MASIEFITPNRRSSRRCHAATFAAWCLASVGSLWIAAPAWGGVGLGATTTYPLVVQVGQTNRAVALSITNTSTPTQSITLTSIKHTPSCGTSTTPCPAGSADPGVFLVKGPATGRAGSACDGIAFTIGSPDVTTGEVSFTPGSSVVLPSSGSNCTIDFFVDVLQLPSKNAGAGPIIQTASLLRAAGSAGASGTGGTLITVQGQPSKDDAPALSAPALGVIVALLTAFGMVRLRRRSAYAAS